MKIENRKYIAFIWVAIFTSLLFGKELSNTAVDKVSRPNLANGPSQSVVNINNIAYWMTKSTGGTISGSGNGTQVDYPIGTGGMIYLDGFLWGAKVRDGGVQEIRVGGCTYYDGVKAGYVRYNAAGQVIGSSNPADHHIWRVRKDYKTADLTADASNFFAETGGASAGQVQEVYDQYDYDWTNWPADWGAPYDDIDSDGSYDPDVDIPGYPGADQTMWAVANDVPTIVDANGTFVSTQNTAPNIYGADPIGIEIQVTMWAYNYGSGDPLGNIVFKSAKVIYTGIPTTPAGSTMDETYFTQWSDPDLGTYTDDYVGCDIGLSFGYVYNGNRVDGVFNGIYNLPVPSGGYDFLQGPIDDDGNVLGMTAFTYFGAGSAIDDPDFTYDGSLQFYNLKTGFLPRPEYPIQTPWVDLATGEITKFVLSGDPVYGGGWLDGIQLPPGDRRLVMSSGPFTMEIGDEQEIILAFAAGMGKDALTSVTVAKFHDLSAQYAFDVDFDLPKPPSTPVVTAHGDDGRISLDWAFDNNAVKTTEDVVSKGYTFEGYTVYQLPSLNAPLTEGVRVETYDRVNSVVTVFDKGVDPSTGYVLLLPKQTGKNKGLQHYFESNYDEVRGRPMSNGIEYYYGVTAYSYKHGNTPDDPFVTIESNAARIAVMPHTANPGFSVPVDFGGSVDIVHDGTGGGVSADITVRNTSELTGDSYKIYFNQKHYYVDVDGVWKDTAFPDAIGKTMDVSGSSVSGVAKTAVSGLDLIFVVDVTSPDYNYASGVLIEIPGATINSATGPAGIFGVIQPDGQSVLFGDLVQDGAGDFAGGETVTINVDGSTVNLPILFNYIVYDDAWSWVVCDEDGDGVTDPANVAYCNAYGLGPGNVPIANAVGTGLITDVGYAFETIPYWNAMNTTTGEMLVEDGWRMNGLANEHITAGVYYPAAGSYIGDESSTFDGFTIDGVTGSYAAPLDFESLTFADGTEVCQGTNAVSSNDCDWMVDSYFASGWGSADALGAFGYGTASVDILQRDVKVVFDGVLGDPITTATGASYYPVVEGGSQVWIYQGNTVATHPANPSPGTDAPFLLTVPFKVYDVEDPDDPYQIGMIMRDRIQTYDGTDTELYAWNPDDRIYTYFVNRPYEETLNDYESNRPFCSWNVVWWRNLWEGGEELTFVYPNPIQLGIDEITWSTEGFSTSGAIAQDDIDMIQVYPNPYYGVHELENSRSEKFVSFNHLPVQATIRIFTMGGTMVTQIEKDDQTQFATWNLSNQYGYPVASGVYLIHIETDHGEKILKLALVQETQVLKYY